MAGSWWDELLPDLQAKLEKEMEEQRVNDFIQSFSLRLATLTDDFLPFINIRIRIRVKMVDDNNQPLSCVHNEITEVDNMALWDTGSSVIEICNDVVNCTNQDLDHRHLAIVQIWYDAPFVCLYVDRTH
jgi:hypothetical protein